VAAWLPTNPPGAAPPDAEENDDRREPLTVTLPCPGATAAVVHDLAGRPGGTAPLARGGGTARVGPLEVDGGSIRLVTVAGCSR
jgi:hypothetical protein